MTEVTDTDQHDPVPADETPPPDEEVGEGLKKDHTVDDDETEDGA